MAPTLCEASSFNAAVKKKPWPLLLLALAPYVCLPCPPIQICGVGPAADNYIKAEN